MLVTYIRVRTTWIDAKGLGVLTNDLVITGGIVDEVKARIVRFNKSEVALQVEVAFDNAPSTNFLHRIKRNNVVTDTPISTDEGFDAVPLKLLDSHGFFTRTKQEFYTFRRYSN